MAIVAGITGVDMIGILAGGDIIVMAPTAIARGPGKKTLEVAAFASYGHMPTSQHVARGEMIEIRFDLNGDAGDADRHAC